MIQPYYEEYIKNNLLVLKDINLNLDNQDGSQLKSKLSDKFSFDTDILPEFWRCQRTVGGLFKYLIDKFFPNVIALTRWVLLVILLISSVNYCTSHIRQALCQWGWGESKHCEKRPPDWN